MLLNSFYIARKLYLDKELYCWSFAIP